MSPGKITVFDRLVAIANAIRSARCNLGNEKATQVDIERVLLVAGLSVEREAHIGPGDIPDFLVDGRFAIEIKLRAPRRHIIRQLSRYAAYPQIEGLLLASNTSMNLPDKINGKPTLFVSLGAAWL